MEGYIGNTGYTTGVFYTGKCSGVASGGGMGGHGPPRKKFGDQGDTTALKYFGVSPPSWQGTEQICPVFSPVPHSFYLTLLEPCIPLGYVKQFLI